MRARRDFYGRTQIFLYCYSLWTHSIEVFLPVGVGPIVSRRSSDTVDERCHVVDLILFPALFYDIGLVSTLGTVLVMWKVTVPTGDLLFLVL